MRKAMGRYLMGLLAIMLVVICLSPVAMAASEGGGTPARQIDLTPVFQAVLALLASLVTYRLIPWIKSKTTAQQQDTLTGIVRTLVYAAEQIYGSGKGKEKLGYVAHELEKRGFAVDIEAIEAAVREMTMGGVMVESLIEYEPPDQS